MLKTDDTPMRSRVIQEAAYEEAGQSGFSFNIPQPFVPLDFEAVAARLEISAAGLANQVNQVLAENLGNNMAARVKKAAKDGDDLPDQDDMDALYSAYDFTGIRAAGATFGSLFEKIMYRMCGQFIRKLLRQKGYQDRPAPITVAKKSAESLGANEISFEDFEAEVLRMMEGEGPWAEKDAFVNLRAQMVESAQAEEARVRADQAATEDKLNEISLDD